MNYTKKQWLWLLAAVAVGLIANFCIPLTGGLTAEGRTILAILLFCLVGWIAVDTVIPSLAALTVIMLLTFTETSSILASSFGSLLTGILFAPVIFSIPLTKLGIMDFAACWFLSRKFIDKHPYRFFVMLAVAGTALAAVSVMISILTLIPLLLAIYERIGVKKGDKLYIAGFLVLIWNCFTGEAYFPFAKSIYITGTSIFSAMGFEADLGAYMKWSIPMCIVNILIQCLVIRFIVRPNTERFFDYDTEMLRERMRKVVWDGKSILAVICALLFMLSVILPIFAPYSAICAYFNAKTMLPFGLVIQLIYYLVPVGKDRKPLLNFQQTMAEYPWGLALFLSTTMLFSSFMTSADYGISSAVISWISPLTSALSPVGVLICAMALVFIMTNLLSNTVALAIVLPTFLPAILALPGNTLTPLTIFMAIDFLAVIGIMTPSAQPPVPLVIGPHITMKDNFLPSLIMAAVTFGEMVLLVVTGICA